MICWMKTYLDLMKTHVWCSAAARSSVADEAGLRTTPVTFEEPLLAHDSGQTFVRCDRVVLLCLRGQVDRLFLESRHLLSRKNQYDKYSRRYGMYAHRQGRWTHNLSRHTSRRVPRGNIAVRNVLITSVVTHSAHDYHRRRCSLLEIPSHFGRNAV